MAKFFLVLSIIVMVGTGGCGLVFATGGWADAALVLAGPPFAVALIICIICYNVINKRETPDDTENKDQ